MSILKRNAGQFVPITAMVTFTLVMFFVAVANVYKVSRTKLKLQNIADAAALNLAAQQSQGFNVVTDRNEWLNNMVEGIPSPSSEGAPGNVKDCSIFNAQNVLALPGISCIENPFDPDPKKDGGRVASRHIFGSRDGAINYALTVHSINQAQKLFVQAYNSFLGADRRAASSSSATQGTTNFQALLRRDIPDLDKDRSIRLLAWNQGGEPGRREVQETVDAMTDENNLRPYNMQPMQFKVDHDIRTVYKVERKPLIGAPVESFESKTFSELLYGSIDYNQGKSQYGRRGPLAGRTPVDGNGVGWMVPDWGRMPQISLQKAGAKNQIGVGVYVTKTVKLPVIGQTTVMAKSLAYLVKGTGINTEVGGSNPHEVPRFKPTYWVKLAN